MFVKAIKEQLKAKIMLDGSSGSGKTYGALRLAKGLGGKIALLDTENRSASLYADRFEFDVENLSAPYTPEAYIDVINGAVESGYDVLIIDSMTHEWSGQGGVLEIKDKIGPSFQDWAKVTPRHNNFIDAIINAPIHIITTVRTKTGYEMGESNGKRTVTKVGLQPITRDGFEYENTVVFTINENNFACSKKDRTSMFGGKDFMLTEEVGEQLAKWLDDGQSIQETLDIITKACKNLKTKEEWTKARESLTKDGYYSKPEQKSLMLELFKSWDDKEKAKEAKKAKKEAQKKALEEATPEEILQAEFSSMIKTCSDSETLEVLNKLYEDNTILQTQTNQDSILNLSQELEERAVA